MALLAVEAVLAAAPVGEPQSLRQQAVLLVEGALRRVGPGPLNSDDRVLGGNFRVLGAQRRIAGVTGDKRQREAVVVAERQRADLTRGLIPT